MFSIGERTTLNPCGSFLWTPANSLKSDPLEISNTRGTQNSWKSYNPGGKKKKKNQFVIRLAKTEKPFTLQIAADVPGTTSSDLTQPVGSYPCTIAAKIMRMRSLAPRSFGFRYLGRTSGEEAIQNGRNPRCRSDRRGARRGQTDRGFVYSGAAAATSSSSSASGRVSFTRKVREDLPPSFFFHFFSSFLNIFYPFFSILSSPSSSFWSVFFQNSMYFIFYSFFFFFF